MHTIDVSFNYYVIGVVSLILVSMLAYALVAKLFHERRMLRHSTLLKQYLADIEALVLAGRQQIDLFCEENPCLCKVGIKRDVFEEALLQTINRNDEYADRAREIAHKFAFPEEAMVNLKSDNPIRRLKGCQQAGTYLHEPALPLLFDLLHFTVPQLQYNALLALASFRQPAYVVQSFDMVKDALLVNDRTVREIVEKMGDKKAQLFQEILETDSPVLISLFLTFIDEASANVYLDDIAALADSPDVELRISAMRALSETKNKRALPELIEALADEAWEVRAMAAKGMRQIPNEAHLPLLRAMKDTAWWVRQNAAFTALEMPRPEVLVKKVLQSGDPYAIDAMQYAAEMMGMAPMVDETQKKLAAGKQLRWERKPAVARQHA